jgi:hypothetical protein
LIKTNEDSKKNQECFLLKLAAPQDTKETLQWLMESSHRSYEEFNLAFEQITRILAGECEMSDGVKKLVDDLKNLPCSVNRHNIEYINPEIIYHCKSTNGWHLIRGIHMAQYDFGYGFLSEEEAWDYIIKFSQMVKQEFSSWEELAISFILGQYIFSRGNDQKKSIEGFSRIYPV